MGLSRRFAAFRNRVARMPGVEPSSGAEAPFDGRPRLIVGLGNPEPKYEQTRHNAGARCVALLAARHGASMGRGKRAWTASVELDGAGLHLVQSRSYYNESGGAVQAELRRLGLPRQALLVVYDEIDLPVGQLRIRLSGGHGGNNGMRSILGAVGGGDFARIRIGVDRPYDEGRPVRDPDRVADWVLSRPGRGDRELLDAAIEKAADAIEVAAREGVEAAMQRFNPHGSGGEGG